MALTKMRVVGSTAAVVAALALGLVGCSGSEPGPSSSSSALSSSSTPSPSPTTTAAYKPADANGPAQNVPKPEKPALADEFSEKGLDAFTRYWYAAYNYAVETGDIEAVTKITQISCSYCNKVLGNIDAQYKAKGWSVGGQIIVTRSQISDLGLKSASNGAYQMMVQFNLPDATSYKSDGSVGETRPSSVANGAIFNATYQESRWSVYDIGKIG